MNSSRIPSSDRIHSAHAARKFCCAKKETRGGGGEERERREYTHRHTHVPHTFHILHTHSTHIPHTLYTLHTHSTHTLHTHFTHTPHTHTRTHQRREGMAKKGKIESDRNENRFIFDRSPVPFFARSSFVRAPTRCSIGSNDTNETRTINEERREMKFMALK